MIGLNYTERGRLRKVAARKDQLCWLCTKACGGCCWSDRGEPVPGWDAKKKLQPAACGGNKITTYAITGCPEYDPDHRAIEWEKSYLSSGNHGGGKARCPVKATSNYTGKAVNYSSIAAACRFGGFRAERVVDVLEGRAKHHHGWRFERLEGV